MVFDTAALGTLISDFFGSILLGNPIILGVLLLVIISVVIGMSRMGFEGAIAIFFGFVYVFTDLLGILDVVFKILILAVIGLFLGIGLLRAFRRD